MSKSLIGKDNRYDNTVYWIDEGIDLESRKILINGEIDDKLVGRCIRALLKMTELNQESPIDIYINSPGGSVEDGFALYDIIRTRSVLIRTHAIGQVASMAFILYLSGDERYSRDNTRFMHHKCKGSTDGTPQEMKADSAETGMLDEMTNVIVAKATKKRSSFWETKISEANLYFGKKEARKWGVVTHEYEEK